MMNDNGGYGIPSGYRFKPDDETLINLFLSKKIKNQWMPPDSPITEMIIYGDEALEPYKIAENMGLSEKQSLDAELFFFTIAKKRQGRVVGEGTWKIDRTREIKAKNGNVIGFVTTFNFVVKGKTFTPSWIMREYKLNRHIEYDQWVICKITRAAARKASDDNNTNPSTSSSCVVSSKRPLTYDNGDCSLYPRKQHKIIPSSGPTMQGFTLQKPIYPPQPHSSNHQQCSTVSMDNNNIITSVPCNGVSESVNTCVVIEDCEKSIVENENEKFTYAELLGECEQDTVLGDPACNGIGKEAEVVADTLHDVSSVTVSPSSQSNYDIQWSDLPKLIDDDDTTSTIQPIHDDTRNTSQPASAQNQSEINWDDDLFARLQEDNIFNMGGSDLCSVVDSWDCDYLQALCC
ncbi:hypothetical protein ACHQM5_015689 [Ranunculus cassubicifolius]